MTLKPSYSKNEEIFNTVSHLVGVVIGILTIIFTPFFSHDNYGLVSGIIFGICLIILYSMSSLYHGLSPKLAKAKSTFQIFDHCSIFVLIAGSYTPLVLCGLRRFNSQLGWNFFFFIWGIAILGIILNIINLEKFKLISLICYLLMGWSIVIKIGLLFRLIGITGSILLFSGGLMYTIGSISYVQGKHHKWRHSIFHLFCLLEAFCIVFVF